MKRKKITNCLAIVLRGYPYGNGETFFHRELLTLSESFDEILILTQHPQLRAETHAYAIPENVTVQKVFTRVSNWEKWYCVLKFIFSKQCFQLFKVLRKRKLLGNPLPLKSALEYEVQAISLGSSILNSLKLIDREPHDYTWYSYWTDSASYLLAKWKSKGFIKKAYCKTHGYDIYEERHPFNYLPFRDVIFNNLDTIICISAHGLNYLTNKYPSFQHKFKLFKLGVDNQTPVTTPKILPLRILSISWIGPIKNLKILIEAIAMQEQEIQWYHMGDGSMTEYEKMVKRYADELLNNKPNIEFNFLGFVPNNLVLKRIAEINPHVLINSRAL